MEIIIYIIAGAASVFLLINTIMLVRIKFKKGAPAPEIDGAAGEKIKSGEKVIFYFYSPSCGSCRPMTPVIEKLASKNENIFKINVIDNMELAGKFGIMGTPSLIVAEKGKITEFLVGFQSAEKIYSLL